MKKETIKTTKKGAAGKAVESSARVSAKAEVSVPKAQRAGKRATQAKNAVKKTAKAAKKSAKASVSTAKATRRSIKTQAVSAKKQTRKGATKGKRRWLIGLAALILVIAGGITAAVCLWEHEAPAEEIVAEEVIEEEPELEPVGPADGNEPLVPETEIPDWSAYTVAANKPRYLTIAAVDLYNVPIIEVGLTGEGAMGAPDSSYIVGWYYRSAYPGRVGKWATVIDGHGGPLGDGVFKWLPNLVPGNEIVIEMGDGRKFTYAVTEMVYKDKGVEADAYMKVADRPVDAETPTLTLITCTGEWIRAEQTYTQRLFVRAVLKE